MTFDAVLRATSALAKRHPQRAAQLRAAMDAYTDLMTERYANPTPEPLPPADSEGEALRRFLLGDHYRLTASPTDPLLGYAVVLDHRLPHGVWRLVDAYGGTLYDPRSGKTLREIRAPS